MENVMLDRQLIEVLQDKDDWLILFSRFIKLTDSCWLWKGSGGHEGSAVFGYKQKTMSAVRIAYNIANGNDPDVPAEEGKIIMHSCDNPMCVNPDHLSIGTHQDNTDDAIKKGRGPKYTPVKLSYDLAEKIRAEYAEGGVTQLELAKRYNVTLRNMQMLMARDIWDKPRRTKKRVNNNIFMF
jgi:hypothetical protein